MSPAFTVGVLIFKTLRWNPTHMSDAAWLALIGLATVIVAAVPATVTALTTRHLAVQARDHAASASADAADAKKTLGEINGNGDVVQMMTRVLGKVDALDERLDERTHVTRRGKTEPESLASYIQDWMHEIGTQLTVIKGTLDVLWIALKDDYQLPDLPSIVPPPEPSEENP